MHPLSTSIPISTDSTFVMISKLSKFCVLNLSLQFTLYVCLCLNGACHQKFQLNSKCWTFSIPHNFSCFFQFTCQVVQFHHVEDVLWGLSKIINAAERLTEEKNEGGSGKESACNAGDRGSVPELERSSGEVNGNPPQYSCLGNPMDRGAWGTTVHGVAKSWTWLGD